MPLHPLSPRQLAASLLVAVGDGKFEPTTASLQALEKQSADLMATLDPRTRDFQSSSRERCIFPIAKRSGSWLLPAGPI